MENSGFAQELVSHGVRSHALFCRHNAESSPGSPLLLAVNGPDDKTAHPKAAAQRHGEIAVEPEPSERRNGRATTTINKNSRPIVPSGRGESKFW